jgi:hypothetical protein
VKRLKRHVVVIGLNKVGKDTGIILNLDEQLVEALRPWTCPQCGGAYEPPLTTYISPRDGIELCGSCADEGGAP